MLVPRRMLCATPYITPALAFKLFKKVEKYHYLSNLKFLYCIHRYCRYFDLCVRHQVIIISKIKIILHCLNVLLLIIELITLQCLLQYYSHAVYHTFCTWNYNIIHIAMANIYRRSPSCTYSNNYVLGTYIPNL